MSVRSKRLIVAEGVLFVVAVLVAAWTSTAADWQPAGLVLVLLALALGTDLFAVSHEAQRISGSFLALVLAMSLLGRRPRRRSESPPCSPTRYARATRSRA